MRPWSQEEDATLRALIREGHNFREIARRLGRTRNSCIGRSHGLPTAQWRPPVDPNVIAEMHAAGATSKEIAERLGFSVHTVRFHKRKLGLSAIQHYTPEETDQIIRLWIAGGTPSTIAKAFPERSRRSVEAKIRNIGLSPGEREVPPIRPSRSPSGAPSYAPRESA